METDDRSSEFDMYGSGRKLTWISREHHRSFAPNSDDCPSSNFQKDFGRPASCRIPDSPSRGVYNRPESPLRKGESVRRIRTPSMDVDAVNASGKLFTSRLGSFTANSQSESIKGGLAVVKRNRNGVMEAPGTPRNVAGGAAANGHWMAPKQLGFQSAATEDSLGRSTGDSAESDRLVMSYLAEETDRIFKSRLKLRSNSFAVPQLQSIDHEPGSAPALRSGRRPPSLPSRLGNKTVDEKVNSFDKRRDHGAREMDGPDPVEIVPPRRPGTPGPQFLSGSPRPNGRTPLSPIGEGIGPTRFMSPTMEKYLESRKNGTSMGSQLVFTPRQGPAPVSTEPPSNPPALSNGVENPSSKIGIGRYDHFSTPRVVLSPLNGNEGVTHSPLLSQVKDIYSTDPEAGRRNGFKESVLSNRQDGDSDRLKYWAEFMGNGEVVSHELIRHLAQRVRDRTSAAGGEKTETTLSKMLHSNGTKGLPFYPETRQLDRNVRHPGARGHSQRIGEVGKSLLSERVLTVGSQSCRLDPIINPLLQYTKEEGPRSLHVKTALGNISSGNGGSRRWNVPGSPLPTSCRTIKERSASLAQVEESKITPNNDFADRSKVVVSYINAPLSQSGPIDHEKEKADRAKMLHSGSQSFDQDMYNKLVHVVQNEKDNRNGEKVASSRSLSKIRAMDSPRATTPRSSSPGANLQRWLVNQFKLGSRTKSSKDMDLQEEKKVTTKSPWRTRPGEIFQSFTRRKGGSGPAAIAPLLDTKGLQNLRQGRVENGTKSFTAGISNDAQQRRMMHREAQPNGYPTPAYRKSHLQPSFQNASPSHSRGFHNLFSTHGRQG